MCMRIGRRAQPWGCERTCVPVGPSSEFVAADVPPPEHRDAASNQRTRNRSNLVHDFEHVDFEDLGNLEELDEIDPTSSTFDRRYHRLVSADPTSELMLSETGALSSLHEQIDELDVTRTSQSIGHSPVGWMREPTRELTRIPFYQKI